MYGDLCVDSEHYVASWGSKTDGLLDYEQKSLENKYKQAAVNLCMAKSVVIICDVVVCFAQIH